MKTFLVLVLCVFLAGCGTVPASEQFDLQALLTALLPAGFRGDAYIYHKNPYIDFRIDAGNLRRNESGKWEFDWLVYHRNGRASNGDIILGDRATVAAKRF